MQCSYCRRCPASGCPWLGRGGICLKPGEKETPGKSGGCKP